MSSMEGEARMAAAAGDRKTHQQRSETRDGMRIDWDVPITMDDGVVLRADVFRPEPDGSYPALISYGPYAKGLAFQDGYPDQWAALTTAHPEVLAGSTNRYQNWEVVDPERWVPDGYVCVRVDSRGTGRSPGFVDHFSWREARDFHDCIEWAAAQRWSNGRIGTSGVSYYGMNQWQVASLRPPHLAAMCVWEGASDWYRDATHHGGILSTFWEHWYDMQVKTVQYGLASGGPVNPNTGTVVCGGDPLSERQLRANRSDFGAEIRAHPLDDDYHRERSAVWDRLQTPLLSAGNWGGQGLHLRGNVEGFVRAATDQKWLEMHGLEHWTSFYTDEGIRLQKRFFGHFLKHEDTGWEDQPKVLLRVRHIDGSFVDRREHEWPLARTLWTRLYLDVVERKLQPDPVSGSATAAYDPLTDEVTFTGPPLEEQTELTGPAALHVEVSSSTADADIFAVLRVFDADGAEVTFQGAIDPHTPIGQGWLRASHRKLDQRLTRTYRPYHTHDEEQPLVPGEIVAVDVEILPTSLVIPAGYRLAVTISGRDYEFAGDTPARLSNFKNELKGCGPFLHDDPQDRPLPRPEDRVTLHAGDNRQAYLLLPIVPPREAI
jgi:predicted acyl esterase